ncbi:hypothetical protein T439DRAFT_383691 [Meredithblackwellia eburnea MCA 4105]
MILRSRSKTCRQARGFANWLVLDFTTEPSTLHSHCPRRRQLTSKANQNQDVSSVLTLARIEAVKMEIQLREEHLVTLRAYHALHLRLIELGEKTISEQNAAPSIGHDSMKTIERIEPRPEQVKVKPISPKKAQPPQSSTKSPKPSPPPPVKVAPTSAVSPPVQPNSPPIEQQPDAFYCAQSVFVYWKAALGRLSESSAAKQWCQDNLTPGSLFKSSRLNSSDLFFTSDRLRIRLYRGKCKPAVDETALCLSPIKTKKGKITLLSEQQFKHILSLLKASGADTTLVRRPNRIPRSTFADIEKILRNKAEFSQSISPWKDPSVKSKDEKQWKEAWKISNSPTSKATSITKSATESTSTSPTPTLPKPKTSPKQALTTTPATPAPMTTPPTPFELQRQTEWKEELKAARKAYFSTKVATFVTLDCEMDRLAINECGVRLQQRRPGFYENVTQNIAVVKTSLPSAGKDDNAKGLTDKFSFGTTTAMTSSELFSHLDDILSASSSKPVFVIFHGGSGDIQCLQALGFAPGTFGVSILDYFDGARGVFVLDTQRLMGGHLELTSARSLRDSCAHFKIEATKLHVAGNDAYYTFELFKKLMDKFQTENAITTESIEVSKARSETVSVEVKPLAMPAGTKDEERKPPATEGGKEADSRSLEPLRRVLDGEVLSDKEVSGARLEYAGLQDLESGGASKGPLWDKKAEQLSAP